MVTAHDIGASYRTAVLLTRDPYDYCLSTYHYRYARRRGRSGVTLDRAIPDIVATWAATEIAQRRLLEADPERVRRVRYEELIAEPERTIGEVVRFIGVDILEGDLRAAIDDAGADRLRDHEIRTGRAAVAGDDFTAPHFVRSGRVGEGREVLSPAQLRRIEEELDRHGVAQPGYGADAG